MAANNNLTAEQRAALDQNAQTNDNLSSPLTVTGYGGYVLSPSGKFVMIALVIAALWLWYSGKK